MKIISIYFFLIGTVTLFTLFLLTNVSKSLSENDITAIKTLDVNDECLVIDSFEEEILCIQSIQNKIFNIINFQSDFSHLSCLYDQLKENEKVRHEDYEPFLFLQNGGGCCVLRSRFLEKALIFYGFEVRHLGIYRAKSLAEVFFSRKIISHSSTEVKTTRGWMYVDSVDKFIGITNENLPITSAKYKIINKDELKYKFIPSEGTQLFIEYSDKFNNWNRNNNIWNEDYNTYIIYGLHSRHGNFYWPKFKTNIPDISWTDFKYNLFNFL